MVVIGFNEEIRLMERVLGSKFEFFYRPEDRVFSVTPKAAEYREIKILFHLPAEYPLHEPRVQVVMLVEDGHLGTQTVYILGRRGTTNIQRPDEPRMETSTQNMRHGGNHLG